MHFEDSPLDLYNLVKYGNKYVTYRIEQGRLKLLYYNRNGENEEFLSLDVDETNKLIEDLQCLVGFDKLIRSIKEEKVLSD